jgi:photosystem II stability/assembly factor-like uncharacterized protein
MNLIGALPNNQRRATTSAYYQNRGRLPNRSMAPSLNRPHAVGEVILEPSPSWACRRTAVCVVGLTLICTAPPLQPQWLPQKGGTDARLRGLCVVDRKVVWASGTKGTYLHTGDGGKTWNAGVVPGASDLDFRDVHAFDGRTAHLLAIGEGDKSRIYRTTDGGKTWALSFQNRDPKGFLDALAFWDADHGITLGDPIDGRFLILKTDDGGANWKRQPGGAMPPVLQGEGAFAASGTCLVVQGNQNVWFGTGGANVARVFRSVDRGQSWTVHETPIRAGNASSGIFSLAFRNLDEGIAVGGDYKQPEKSEAVVTRSSNGGRSWSGASGTGTRGYRSCVVFVPGTGGKTAVVVGPSGSDFSTDGGASWHLLGAVGFHAVGFAGPSDAGWAVGDNGSIARFQGEVKER